MILPPEQRRFRCTACGRCCHGGRDAIIEVADDEITRIADWLGMEHATFVERCLMRDHEADKWSLAFDADGACRFLEHGRCSIYPVRPMQCRSYPWWPELLGDAAAWEAEKSRCEGIGQGEIVPLDEVIGYLRYWQRRNS